MDPANPFAAAMQGYQFGAGIRDDQLKQQQLALAQAQQQQLQQDILAVRQSTNPSQGIADLALKYPQLSEQFKRSYDMMSAEQQQNRLSYGTQVYAAIQNNQPQLAVQMMRQRAESMKASGAMNEAQGAAQFADLIEKSPEAAKVTAGLMLSGMMGPEKFATTFAQLGTEQRAQEQAPADLAKKNAEAGIKLVEAGAAPQKTALEIRKGEADIQNTLSQIGDRGARLGLDRDKLTTDTQIKLTELNKQFGELPADARKNLNDSAAAATASEQGASQMQNLASQLEAAGGGYGSFGSASEWIKKATGNQDGMTALRQEYTRLRSQGVMKLLPPGPATDRDVALAMEGFPPATADSKQLASFLRGMAKLQTYDAVLNNAKAQWFGEVQHLGSTKKDITIDGVKVPAGSSFNDFASKYVSKKAAQVNGANFVNSLAEKYGAPQTGGASGSY